MSLIDERLRYATLKGGMPAAHKDFFEGQVQGAYGDHMLQIIAMPMNGDHHPGGHVQLLKTKAPVSVSASMVAQPFATRIMHRVFSKDLTENMIRDEIAPDIINRLAEFKENEEREPVLIETHFDPRTTLDSNAGVVADPGNATIRFLKSRTPTGNPCILLRIETKASPHQGKELCDIASNMNAEEYARGKAVQWAEKCQMRYAQQLLNECVSSMEDHVGGELAERTPDTHAKIGTYEVHPTLAQHNGPWSVSSTARYFPPQFKTSDRQNDPRTQGIVVMYPNCVGKAGIGAMLEGNLTDPLIELHAKPEVHPSMRGIDGGAVYRSPNLISNNVFGALPAFQPSLSADERAKILQTYNDYPTLQEEVSHSVLSASGNPDLSHYFARFRRPTSDEMRNVTCSLSNRAFGLSGKYTSYEPIMAIVP